MKAKHFVVIWKKTPISFSLFVAWLVLEVIKQSFVQNN